MKTKILTIRVSPDQHQKFRRLAKVKGRTLSDAVRWAALEAARELVVEPKGAEPALAQVAQP
jgi:uncharacterized protein (DUF1778 family)